MPWLYFNRPQSIDWAEEWQSQIHAELASLEDVRIDPSSFVAPDADIFAEPGRPVVVGPRSSVAARAFVHGPVTLGSNVSLNVGCSVDGGAAGIRIGDGTRVAAGARIYAFDHGMCPDASIREQPVHSRGIDIGCDVWLGANSGVTDGVVIGDHAVVAMGAVVTQNVPPWAIVAGVPARVVGDRRSRKSAR